MLKLQSRIKDAYTNSPGKETQIVIYGEKGHAEVNGLVGQTEGKAIIVEKETDLSKLDLSKNIRLFSQTTKSLEGFNTLIQNISDQKGGDALFEYSDTICRQVSNRIPNITTFAKENEIVIFVSGKKSSNGKVLYEHSKSINPDTYIVSEPSEVLELNLDLTKKIGICGATSTPMWLMEKVAETLRSLEK
ncbi:4-hydroxy-3-methylbut-2-enyl diphosphate reductase [bioreactor metagenome]|uniref:4-hydroxy-3-methylbut-2-enyl diphosphate reductase n=1 Tax=bioreactor metagenome TaxID=1076179 RepID=A0A645HCJ5_9ZZZZ